MADDKPAPSGLEAQLQALLAVSSDIDSGAKAASKDAKKIRRKCVLPIKISLSPQCCLRPANLPAAWLTACDGACVRVRVFTAGLATSRSSSRA